MATNFFQSVTTDEIKSVAALSNNDRANLAAQINSTDPFTIFDLVDGKTNQIVCPFCGSGAHGHKNTGIEPNFENGIWLYHCFAANDCEGDLIKIIADANHLSTKGKDFLEVLAIGAKILGITIATADFKPARKSQKKKTAAPMKQQTIKPVEKVPAAEYARLAESREKLASFVKNQGGAWRGLSLETLQRLNWGFLPDIYFSDANKKLPALIIPNDLNGIFARSIEGGYYRNYKPTATTTIFLPDSDSFDLIITEGAITGASILQAVPSPSFGIIASGGTSGDKNVLAKCQQLKNDGKNFRVLIACDNDTNQAGQKAADKWQKMLISAGYPVCNIDITKQADIDLNDVLRGENGAAILADMVNSAVNSAQIELDKIEETEREMAFERILKNRKTRVKISDGKSNTHGVFNMETPRKELFSLSDDNDNKKFSDSQVPNDYQMTTKSAVQPRLKKEGFYTTADVAKILKVKKQTVEYWRKKNWFVEDILDHNGVYWYSIERVEQLQSVYCKDWETAWARGNDSAEGFDEIANLNAELQEVEKQLADFDAEKQAALETIRNAETFDKDFVFSDDMIHAAAVAKLYDNGTFSDLKSAIQNHIKAQKIPPFLTEWQGEIKIAAEKIQSRLEELQTLKNELQSRITNAEFVAHNNVMKDFTIPENFIVHRDKGILRPHKKQLLTVCRRPIIVTEKFKSLDDSMIKYVLAHRMKSGDWKFLKPMPASEILNPRKLSDLSNLEAPVTGANSLGVVDWLDAFLTENEKAIPVTYTVRRGGWYKFNGTDYFLDPRRTCEYTDKNANKRKVVVEENNFTKALTTEGNLGEWRKTYELIKKYPVARFIVSASIAAPLLKILNERTFILYVYGRTTSGKSTALKFGASTFGNPEKVVRNFNGTTKGLAELATLTDNYSLLIDEKQAADEKLRDNFIQLVYSFSEEQGRTRLDSNADLRTVEIWKSIILMNGEEPLHDDNATAGSFTRVLSLAIKEKILPPDICKEVWHTIRSNFGLVFNLYIDEILKYGIEKLPEKYADIVSVICDLHKNLLPEHVRYLSVVTIADFFLNLALGVDKKTAFDNAVIYVNEKIIPLIPTIKDIDETSRHRDFVLSFISRYAPHFIGSDFYRSTSNLKPYGKYDREKGYLFIDATKLNEYCTEKGYSSKIVAGNLVADGFFVPADTVDKGSKTPRLTTMERIGSSVRCYRIKLETLNKDEDI